jgi:hypothetical protein
MGKQLGFPHPGPLPGERGQGARPRLFLALSWDLFQAGVRGQALSAKEDIGDPL